MSEAVSARLMEELGISCPCKEEFTFSYFHEFQNGLYEYEFDHVFIGRYAGACEPNPREAMNVKWVDFRELIVDVSMNPGRYSVWFITALPKVLEIISRGS